MTTTQAELTRTKLAGCLLGMAVGDALGLPREGLPRRRAARLFGDPPLRHRFVFGHGMVSDDTEHAMMVAESLCLAGEDIDCFTRTLAWKLRLWLLALPAGVGMATARAVLKLWVGFSPAHSGVRSAGNGPAMRAPILGAVLASRPETLRDFVIASTRLTHTDPRAEQGSLLIAWAAQAGALAGPVDAPGPLLAAWRRQIADPGLQASLDRIAHHLARGSSVQALADDLGLQQGVGGFISHTVPVVLYAWLRHPRDFRLAVESVITLGGDADTTGAIIGGLLGATLGEQAIPAEWLDGLAEWPKTRSYMRRLVDSLVAEESAPLPGYCWPGILPRNIGFLLIVLYHGFRRLFPPY